MRRIVRPMPSACDPIPVYIVDDSAPIRARIAELVLRSGNAQLVGEADSAAAAIAGIRATQPEAVVLDLRLREGSGLDVLRAFRNVPAAPAFIVVTNEPADGYRKACA